MNFFYQIKKRIDYMLSRNKPWIFSVPPSIVTSLKKRGDWGRCGRRFPANSSIQYEDTHLGGSSINIAPGTYNPFLWESISRTLHPSSILDVGCGNGTLLDFFNKKEEVYYLRGIEGCIEAVNNSKVPNAVVHHDFTSGHFVSADSFDVGFCIEVAEHLHENYLSNLFSTLKLSSIVFFSAATPGQGGYHHVNEQYERYWIQKAKDNGLFLLRQETSLFRSAALVDQYSNNFYNHFANKGLVFTSERDLFLSRSRSIHSLTNIVLQHV